VRLLKLMRWFYPGLKIKRWLLLFSLGVYLIVVGLATVIGRQVLHIDYGFSLPFLAGDIVMQPLSGLLLLAVGVLVVATALRLLISSIVDALIGAQGNSGLAEVLYLKRQLTKGPRVLAVGGGTGLSTLLRGLKEYTSNVTAVVTVTDDGGSSGRLRDEMGILPPGDLRSCLVALADREPLMEEVFQYRFVQGGMAGHNLGNLFIGAMADILGDFEKGIQEASKVLAIRGRVLPATLEQVRLGALLVDGREVLGETNLSTDVSAISKVFLEPSDPKPTPGVLKAIDEAELIVIGPGSLYTSVLPNLLIPGVAEAIAKSEALVIYVVNVMTQPGETDGYSVTDHLEAIRKHVGDLVDIVVYNTEQPSKERLAPYKEQQAELVRKGVSKDTGRVRFVGADLLNEEDLVRHDPEKLARVLLRIFFRYKSGVEPRRLFDFYLIKERLKRT